jgi:threonine aldolase
MRLIDFRSDTVTKPTDGMLKAMFMTEVGDDVFGEDPTVVRLEKKMAKLFGMDAGLFVPSGTMGNQLALHIHSKPGEEVICDFQSHI